MTVRHLVLASFLLATASLCLSAQGKKPVILIPGITGSELINERTKEKVWFRAVKPKDDDIRLPISIDLTKNRDDIVAGDVIRFIKVGPFALTDAYGGFIKAMELRGGYREEKWDAPSADGDHDSLYVFPYDWRLDNVHNARLLIRRVDALRQKLNKPDLKFDIVAHSMGGIISRYAAMYGDADLPAGAGKINPTWAGAKYFDKVILMGTPNEGALPALGALLNGFSLGGMKLELPFLQDSSRFTAFTIPACYQLLPAPGTLRAYDDRLEPIELDLYDKRTWARYGWDPIAHKDFPDNFALAERRSGPEFFEIMLARAKRLHEALGAANGRSGGVAFHVLGADCRDALDAIVLYRDAKDDKYRTLFQPKGFTRSDGYRVSDNDLKKVMFSPGDGMVTRRSLEAVTASQAAKVQSILGGGKGEFICEDHQDLAANSRVQDRIISFLDTKTSVRSEDQDKL